MQFDKVASISIRRVRAGAADGSDLIVSEISLAVTDEEVGPDASDAIARLWTRFAVTPPAEDLSSLEAIALRKLAEDLRGLAAALDGEATTRSRR